MNRYGCSKLKTTNHGHGECVYQGYEFFFFAKGCWLMVIWTSKECILSQSVESRVCFFFGEMQLYHTTLSFVLENESKIRDAKCQIKATGM